MNVEDCTDMKKTEHSIPLDILSDLITRFIIHVPPESKQNFVRICFQIELAHWFYLDFYVSNDNRLRGCSFNEFAAHIFQHIPALQPYGNNLNQIVENWRVYKQSVPTYGAIILSEGLSHVLLVQSYFSKSSWGFPKGKVNQEEDPTHCAIREVLEETGFDITNYIDSNLYFESIINEQLVRLYVIKEIPMETNFQPRTRNEIKACEWFLISDLPNNKKDLTPKLKMGVNANAFFMVLPFIRRIKALSQRRQRYKSSSVSENEMVVITNGKNKNGLKSESDSCNKNVKKRENRERKNSHSKRKLFNGSSQHVEQNVFQAPSWLNFKFDKLAIMECIP